MFSGRTTTTVSAPASSPIDLNSAGKPDWRELAPLFGLTIATLIPAAAGGAMAVSNWPSQEVSGFRFLWWALGLCLCVGGGRFFWTLSGQVLRGVKSYYDRVEAWHDATLSKYLEGDGQVTAHQVSEWTYSEVDIRTVALAALWLVMQSPTPKSLSIEKLTKGPMLLNVGHRSYKLMDMTQDGAEMYLNLLSRAGIINGRAPRTAGSISIIEPRQAITKILAEASRNPAMIGDDT